MSHKMIDRARKLMAMASDSSSPYEAAIAARRARSIIDEYQLTNDMLADQSDYGVRGVGKARSRHPVWEQGLGIAIAKLNDCFTCRDTDGRRIFKGFDEDVQVCEFMFNYLVAHGNKLAEIYMKTIQDGSRSDFKMSYMGILVTRMGLMLEERKKLVNENGQSLILIKADLLAQEFRQPDYNCRGVETARSYSSKAGHEVGKRTHIIRSIS